MDLTWCCPARAGAARLLCCRTSVLSGSSCLGFWVCLSGAAALSCISGPPQGCAWMNPALVFPRSWGPVGVPQHWGEVPTWPAGHASPSTPRRERGRWGVQVRVRRVGGRHTDCTPEVGRCWARMRGVGRAALDARPPAPGFTGLLLGPTPHAGSLARPWLLPTRLALARRRRAETQQWGGVLRLPAGRRHLLGRGGAGPSRGARHLVSRRGDPQPGHRAG